MTHVHRIIPGDLRPAAVDPIDDDITFRAKSIEGKRPVKGGFELKTACQGHATSSPPVPQRLFEVRRLFETETLCN